MTTNEELIEHARELTAHRCVDAPEQDCGQHGDRWARLVGDLAAALEAATTGWEEVTQYGALTVRGETRVEPRGRNYSHKQRTVKFGPWEPVTNEGVKP